MPFQVSVKTEEGKLTLFISGRFDLHSHRDFRDAYEMVLKTEGIPEIILDMEGIDYMDSSALGMLLLLKEKAAARNMEVALANCSETVRKILGVANFNKLFKLK